MQTLTEKRVFGSKFGTTEIFVASETGLVGITVSADQIGEFGLAVTEPVTAVAASDHGVLVGTQNGVQYSPPQQDEPRDTAQSRSFEPIGDDAIEQVVDLTWSARGPVAVDSEGHIAVLTPWEKADSASKTESAVENESTWQKESTWETVGECAAVRAVDGSLIAASDGVYQLTDGALSHVGLTDVWDVASHGTPLAATTEGLYSLGNGWQQITQGAFQRVASDGHSHAHAIGPDGLIRSDAATASSEWSTCALPVSSPVVDVDYGGGIVAAVTENGTLGVTAGDGWRTQLIGVQGVCGLAVGPARKPTGDQHRNRV